MEKNPRKILAPDEVDLVRVFVVIVNFLVRNFKVFVVSTIFGLTLGAGYYVLKSNVYESKMIAECQSIPDSRAVDLLLDLEKIRLNEDWENLAGRLKMNIEEVKKIKKIEPLSSITIEKEATGLDDYLLPTTETAYKFGLIVKVKDNALLPKIQKGIVFYLSENEYSKIRVDRFLENRYDLLNYLNKQIRNLDSLNLLFATKLMESNNSSTINGPGDYKGLLVQLKEKALTIEDQIKFCQPVKIIQPFTAYKSAVEPVAFLVFLTAFLIGNGLGLIFISIRSLNKVYQENKNH